MLLPLLCLPVLDLPASPAAPTARFDIWSIVYSVLHCISPQNPPRSCCYSLNSTEQSFTNHWINSSKWELGSISCSCLTGKGQKGATGRGWASVGSNRYCQLLPLILFFWEIDALLYLGSKHIWENATLNWMFLSIKLHLDLPQYLFVQTALSSCLCI